MHTNSRKGFTLVELAIVLVIIGLIVGGVLVGQDLIKGATVRASITQLGNYDTAANTFRGKYNGLPGDLANATSFFSTVTSASGAKGQGDGNGLVETVSAAGTLCASGPCMAGEGMVFWYELNQAGMIPEAITTTTYTAYTATPSDATLPQSKLGRGARVAIQSVGGRNYYVLANPGTAAAVAGAVTWSTAVTPIDAINIDTKMDDGFPATGKVLSIAITDPKPSVAANGAATASVAATTCYDSTTTAGVYLTTLVNTQTNTDLLVCNLGIRTSF